MKLLLAALAVSAAAVTAQDRPTLIAQDRPAGLKHLTVHTSTSLRPVDVAALEIVRDIPYNSIDHLRGSVEIKTPVCIQQHDATNRSDSTNQWTCDGFVVLHADQADFHEDSGQIEASGNVRVTRENYVHAAR